MNNPIQQLPNLMVSANVIEAYEDKVKVRVVVHDIAKQKSIAAGIVTLTVGKDLDFK